MKQWASLDDETILQNSELFKSAAHDLLLIGISFLFKVTPKLKSSLKVRPLQIKTLLNDSLLFWNDIKNCAVHFWVVRQM